MFAGCIAMLNALIYTELVLTFPESGSDYVYIREGFGPCAAFLYTWVYIFAENAGRAVVALTFSKYFCATIFSSCSPPEELVILLAALALSAVVCIQCYSTKFTILTSDIFTGAKLFGLFLIMAIGVVYVVTAGPPTTEVLLKGTSRDLGDYVLGFYAAFWAYSGVNVAVNVVEEVKLPLKRNMLFSAISAMLTITGVYMFTNLAYVSVLSYTSILASPAVAFTFGAASLPVLLHWVMPFFVACSTFGSMSNGTMVWARVAMAAARQGHLPTIFSLLQVDKLTPVPSLLLGLFTTLLMMASSTLYSLIQYTSYISVLASAMSVVTLLRFRIQYPEMKREFRLPILVPMAYLLISGFLLVYPFYSSPLKTGVCFGIIALGLPIYFLLIAPKERPEILKKINAATNNFVQKLLLCLPEDFESVDYKTKQGSENPNFADEINTRMKSVQE